MTDRRRIKVWSNFTNSYVEYFIPTLHQLHENARNTLDWTYDRVEKQKVHGIIPLHCTRVRSSDPFPMARWKPPVVQREWHDAHKVLYNTYKPVVEHTPR